MKIKNMVFKIILTTILGVIIINICNIHNTYADISLVDIESKAKGFIGNGHEKISEDDALKMLIPVGQILVFVGNAAILIAVAVMGVKWITAKPDQQAKLKQQLIGLVVAAVAIYGAVGIWTILKNLLN